MNQNIWVAAGGTGGHVYPALRIVQALQGAGINVLWIGRPNSFESRVCATHHLKMIPLKMRGFRGVRNKLLTLVHLIGATVKIIYQALLKRPKAVLVMGGYISVPVGIACRILNIPLFLHEQNSILGSANKLLYRWAQAGFCAYPQLMEKYPKFYCTGNPVRTMKRTSSKRKIKKNVLVLGGSQGAQQINDVMLSIYQEPDASAWSFWHVSGDKDFNRLQSALTKNNAMIHSLVPFCDDIEKAYNWCDLVISRAGAMTLAELAYFGRPALLFPYPYATDNHQFFNGEYFVNQGAAIFASEEPRKLLDTMKEVVGEKYQQMVDVMSAQYQKDSSQAIIKVIRQYI